MSITTKKGDDGTTGLMFNRKVPKYHPNVEACGSVDELNAALGLVRAHCKNKAINEQIYSIQNDLIGLMGELATLSEDIELYRSSGFRTLKDGDADRLHKWIDEYSEEIKKMQGWAIPGESKVSAFLDLARTICRRAERRVCLLKKETKNLNPSIVIYLNRLGDLLWLMARIVEKGSDK